MFPRPQVSLQSFLHSAKRALDHAIRHSSSVTFVMGNESADLDSLCSAVVLAYLRTYTSHIGHLYIPLSNLPRADLDLRPELIPVLSRAGLQPSDLITLSDLPNKSVMATQLPAEQTKWILVDHNAMMNSDLHKIYSNRLCGCIDHHAEENVVQKDCKEEPRIVGKCGSCMSLIVDYCKDAWDGYNRTNHKEAIHWNAGVAQVALGPILIDTSNMTNKAEATDKDQQMVEYLEGIISADPTSKYDRDEYYDTVSKAKQDIGGLSLPDILRKDYKQYEESANFKLGIGSVVRSMQFLVDKAGSMERFNEAVKDFAKERDLSILAIMTKSNPPGGGFAREILVWASDERGVSSVQRFEANSAEKLGLKGWNAGSLDLDGDKHCQRCWWQEKVENSRKQVAPLMRAVM